MAKVNISIDDELLRKIDEEADKNYLSRSAMVAYMAAEHFRAAETLEAVNKLMEHMKNNAPVTP